MNTLSLHKNQVLEIIKAVRIRGQLLASYSSVTADSRKVTRDGIFVAIDGFDKDGHKFIPQAIEKGAKLILTSREPEMLDLPANIAAAQVNGIRKVLSFLAFAAFGNPQHALKVVGITGTNGKTTVATLVYQALEKMGYKAGLLGTVERIIAGKMQSSVLTTGDPEEIARDFAAMKEAGCTHVAMEVSSHALDQHRTAAIDFSVAVFTNLSHDHLDYHQTQEAYLSAKKKLFDQLSEKAVAVVNADDDAAEKMIDDTKAQVKEIRLSKDGAMQLVGNTAEGIILNSNGVKIVSPLCGRFNAYNLLSAYEACIALGCSGVETASALQQVAGAKGRLQRVTALGSSNPVVFVDYAHTPDALRNVLETLSATAENASLSVVFGCGGDRDKAKRPVMGRIATEFADRIYLTADNPRTEKVEAILEDIKTGIPSGFAGSVQLIPDRPKAIRQAILEAEVFDIVLIAGKGHETYQEVNGVRSPMDDAELAEEALMVRKSVSTVSAEPVANSKEGR
ncbi:MAG: UDP-N-acetylmuramoyl-L-alanyl-D-glutamate--2,6-diaminopimelate ligase [Balneolales bacterium]|nr:UDP-N-acetylmuramoyl-L-alanyl-D-glutamate--2,6-diaminopimelate ligase [Balneolales bacterium]